MKLLFSINLLAVCISVSLTQSPTKEDYYKVFQTLSEVNQKWLQATSFPEAAFLIQHPPYSYHSSKYVSELLNISDIEDKDDVFQVNDKGDECREDISKLFFNLGSGWALKMLDSDGKLASGVLRGGLIWPGHFGECRDVHASDDSQHYDDFSGKYCVASWKMRLSENSSDLPLTTGICIPDTCSENGMKIATKNILQILKRYPILKQFSSHLVLSDFTCKEQSRSYTSGSIALLCIIIIFVALVFFGSGIHLWDHWISVEQKAADNRTTHILEINHSTAAKNTETFVKNEKNSAVVEINETSSDKAILTSSVDGDINYRNPKRKQPGCINKSLLLCFNAFTNGAKILSTEVAEGQLLSIHGIRFLSLAWVVLGHTYIMSVSMIGNRLDVLKDLDSFPFQVVMQAPFSVDSFFLLSGFLLTYLFMKEADKKTGKINWLYFYVHRFWRLTPPYMMVVFFYLVLFKYMGSGPFWDDHHCEDSTGTWWWYLLYINNFIPIHKMCIGWSWYLANDMQFYLISPLFLYPLWRWPKAGFAIIGSLLLGSWITTAVLSYVYDLIPMFVGVTETQDFQAYEDKMWNSFDLIYDKPYCRIAPYLIGVLLGYALYKTNKQKNFLLVWQQVLGWCIATFCSLSVILGLYHVQMSQTTSLFYNSLCRSSFSIGLAWVIFACETGHGGFITKILSLKFWIPLSRLSYSAYLVHPILIHGFYQAYQTAIFFTQLVTVTNFMGFLLISYVLAFMFSITFESPMMNIEKLILKGRS